MLPRGTPQRNTVLTGLDQLIECGLPDLQGARIGLLTNRSAITRNGVESVTALRAAGLTIDALFAPEHGFAAALPAGSAVPHEVEKGSAIPVYSLYGPRQAPSAEMLAPLSHLVVDLQDVGARFYTYTSTMVRVLQAAAASELPVIVLDRPNPVTGALVEGPPLDDAYRSFVGLVPIPIRHGLTIGEFARLANDELELGAAVRVVPVRGWKRASWFDENALPWVAPSPNIPRPETALAYLGICLLEGTNLSEGRGTSEPFECFGAPWLDGASLTHHLNGIELPGVSFEECAFVPTSSKYAGTRCHGARLRVHDRNAFRPVRAALHVLQLAWEQAPDQFIFLSPADESEPCHFDRLIGSGEVRQALMQRQPVAQITHAWTQYENDYLQKRRPFLLLYE